MSDTQNFDNQQPQQQDTTPQVDTTPPSEQDRLLDNFMRETDGPQRRETTGVPGQTTARSPQDTQQGQRDQTGRTPNQPTGQDGSQSRQPAQVQHVPTPTRTYGNLFLADGNGDIYNAQGQLIAKQGYGRSIFHKLYPYIEAATTENAALRQRVDGYEAANAVAKQNGLTLEDYGAAMHLMVRWKKDPVGTINTLLQVAQERGSDVSSIRGGGAAFDPTALRQVFDELIEQKLQRFQPFVEQNQRDVEARERESAVAQEYNDFMTAFPDAGPHQLSIANVMRDHGMSAREAYFALRAFSASNGLDWNSDLRPQLEARAAGQVQPSGQGNGRQLPPMGGNRGNGAEFAQNVSASVNPDESWNNIIRRTFKQHGIDVP